MAPAFGASQTARIRDLDENEIMGGDSVWKWERGEGLWMAPEWKRGMDTGMEVLFKADIYSCGLLFWYIMRNGPEPWDNGLLGPVEMRKSAFIKEESSGDDMIAPACASMQ